MLIQIPPVVYIIICVIAVAVIYVFAWAIFRISAIAERYTMHNGKNKKDKENNKKEE